MKTRAPDKETAEEVADALQMGLSGKSAPAAAPGMGEPGGKLQGPIDGGGMAEKQDTANCCI
jgi:hypothetical protein